MAYYMVVAVRQAFRFFKFYFSTFKCCKNSLYLSGKVRIGVARPIPLPDDDEEYEESPPDTARYNGEPTAQEKRGNVNQCLYPKHYHMKIMLNLFHLNGHILSFHPQT